MLLLSQFVRTGGFFGVFLKVVKTRIDFLIFEITNKQTWKQNIGTFSISTVDILFLLFDFRDFWGFL